MLRGLLNGVLPLGSERRKTVVAAARRVGVLGPAVPTPYERWIASTEPLLVPNRSETSDTTISLTIRGTASTEPVDLHRSLLSLQGQTHQRWTATLDNVNGACAETATRWVSAEPRISRVAVDPSAASADRINISLAAGDTLAPFALAEAAHAFASGVRVVTADFDYVTRSTNRRLLPHRHQGSDVDSLGQFDVKAGFAASRGDSDVLTLQAGLTEHLHIAQILLHRHVPVGVNTQTLAMHLYPPTDIADVTARWPGAVSAPDPSGYGTWVRHRAQASTTPRVHVFVVEPVQQSAAAVAQRELLRTRTSESNGVDGISYTFSDLPVPRTFGWDSLFAALGPDDNDVVVLVDGSCRFESADALIDLVGVAARQDVFAVSPLVQSPSGIVIDAGIDTTARFGHLLHPPYELVWAKSVRALSSRVVALKGSSTRALRAGLLGDLIIETNDNRLVIWPHVRAIAQFAVASGSDAPPTQVWREPRLQGWFGQDLHAFAPASDAISESFW